MIAILVKGYAVHVHILLGIFVIATYLNYGTIQDILHYDSACSYLISPHAPTATAARWQMKTRRIVLATSPHMWRLFMGTGADPMPMRILVDPAIIDPALLQASASWFRSKKAKEMHV